MSLESESRSENLPPASRHLIASCFLAMLATITAILLGQLFFDFDRVLGNDSYQYILDSRYLSDHWPTHLGDAFPFGFALAGAAIHNALGLHHFTALVLINAVALWLSLFLLMVSPRRRSVGEVISIFALACIPGVYILSVVPMSEMLFACALLAAVLAVERWPEEKALIAVALLLPITLSLRYIGLILSLWTLIHLAFGWRLFDSRRRWLVLGVFIPALAVVALLLASNWAATGSLAGLERPSTAFSLAALVENCVDFGWAISASLVGQGASRLGLPPALRLGMGLTLFGAFTLLCLLDQWRNWKSARFFPSPASLLAGSYVMSLVLLRTLSPFDRLDSARFFVPVLFLSGLMVIRLATFVQKSHLLTAAAIPIVLVGVVLSIRGVSAVTYGNVKSVLDQVPRNPQQSIIVNDQALSLAAYVDLEVIRASDLESLADGAQNATHAVVCTTALDRNRRTSKMDGRSEALVKFLLEERSWSATYQDEFAIVLKNPEKE